MSNTDPVYPGIDFELEGGIKSSGENPYASFINLLSLVGLYDPNEKHLISDADNAPDEDYLRERGWAEEDIAKLRGETNLFFEEFLDANTRRMYRKLIKDDPEMLENLQMQAIQILKDDWDEWGQPYIKAHDLDQGWREKYGQELGIDPINMAPFRAHFNEGDFHQSVPDTMYVGGKTSDYYNYDRYMYIRSLKPDDMSHGDWEHFTRWGGPDAPLANDYGISYSPPNLVTSPEYMDERNIIKRDYDAPPMPHLMPDWHMQGPMIKQPLQTLKDTHAEASHALDQNEQGYMNRVSYDVRAANQRRRYGEDTYNIIGNIEWNAHHNPDNPNSQINIEKRFEEDIFNLITDEYNKEFNINNFIDPLDELNK
tara:strand:+ start:527 stop:1633 length:1107 start_codon:yes stop_codon:yes gene_type:complete